MTDEPTPKKSLKDRIKPHIPGLIAGTTAGIAITGTAMRLNAHRQIWILELSMATLDRLREQGQGAVTFTNVPWGVNIIVGLPDKIAQ